MATIGIGINEMREALQKAGLPMSGRSSMQSVDPFLAKESLSNVFTGQSKSRDLRAEYKDKIAKIAQLDQRLSQIYSDPNSQYFIENPTVRESLKNTTEDIGVGNASNLLVQAQQEDQIAAGNVQDTLSYYNYLTGLEPRNMIASQNSYDEDALLRELFNGENESPSDYTEIDNVLSELGL